MAHLLRKLRELAQTKRGVVQAWALDLMALLHDALTLKAAAGDLGDPVYEAAAADLEGRLDRLIAGALRSRDADRARLGRRLDKHRPEILRFLYWEELDATNNRAERQLRPAVVTRKTGGCNRTATGAAGHAILMSVLATCRQRGMKILDYLISCNNSEPPLPRWCRRRRNRRKRYTGVFGRKTSTSIVLRQHRTTSTRIIYDAPTNSRKYQLQLAMRNFLCSIGPYFIYYRRVTLRLNSRMLGLGLAGRPLGAQPVGP